MNASKYILLNIVAVIAMSFPLSAQVIDTLCNWDGIYREWGVYAGNAQEVSNPQPGGINVSENCFEVTTTNSEYDLIYTDFDDPVSFAEFSLYRIKILAPATGGNILFKFENADNTAWYEIEATPTPGVWVDLEFDFSSVTATDFTRMVIFFDFLGTTPDEQWYLDDVLLESNGAVGLTTNLPIVIINTNGVTIPDEPKIDGEMMIIYHGPDSMNNQYDIPNIYDGNIGIELRGQSAQMFPKKSYSVETRTADGSNLNVPLLGLPEENDWILYAPFSDKSMLRNFMSFYMGAKLKPYCSRMVFCEVIENNDYKGVYILMEKIKKDDNRVNIATLNPEDITGDELTGGYIIRVDKIDPDFVLGEDGWLSIPNPPFPDAKHITYQYYYPKAEDIVEEQKNYIQNYILNTENTLTGSDFNNPETGYLSFINPGSFIDHMILREIAKEVDSYRYSTYFYKEKGSDGGRLFAGPPWDFNLGYANVDYWWQGVLHTGWVYGIIEPSEWGIMFWWKRLMEDVFFEDLFFTRWHQLRQEAFSNEEFNYAIDSITNYISEAQVRNYERWPILGTYVWPNYNWENNNYDDEVDFFSNWLFDRISWIDLNITGELLNPVATISGSLPVLQLDLSDEYFCRDILKNKYLELIDPPPGLSIDTVIRINASTAELHFNMSEEKLSEMAVVVDQKILAGFNDLTTNMITVGEVDEMQLATDINVYASNHSLIVECYHPEMLGTDLQIFDLSGKLISKHLLRKQSRNIISLNPEHGIYIVKLNYGNLSLRKRVPVFLK